MRDFVFFILLTFSGQLAFCQTFLETREFEVVVDEYLLDSIGQLQSVMGHTAYIRIRDVRTGVEIFKTPILSEFYDEGKVEFSGIIGSPSIKGVVKLTVYEQACCVNETYHYLILTSGGDVIELPEFTETFCDGPQPFRAYVFEEIDGKEGQTITLTRFFPDVEGRIETSEVLATYKLANGILNEVDSHGFLKK